MEYQVRCFGGLATKTDDDVACVLHPVAIQVAFTHNAHLRAESLTAF